MVEWMALGPVKDWTATFRTAYDEAATRDHGDTQEAINTFLRGVVEHVRQGKEILAELGRTSLFRMEKGDRLIAGDMQETLHCGVVILEAHLSLAAPSCPLPSNLYPKSMLTRTLKMIIEILLHVLYFTDHYLHQIT